MPIEGLTNSRKVHYKKADKLLEGMTKSDATKSIEEYPEQNLHEIDHDIDFVSKEHIVDVEEVITSSIIDENDQRSSATEATIELVRRLLDIIDDQI